MKDKKLRFKKPKSEEEKRERIAILMNIGCDECRASFITWAKGDTWLDICGMFPYPTGEPVFRPAICAWEAWKAAWVAKSSNHAAILS